MPDPISALALATGGAFLGKFVGPAAEHLGKLALERAQQLSERATALLSAVGREPQPVEPKLLVPLVQAASLETDETLSEKWAALLANAADPAQRVAVQPGFAEVLRQLTPTDARVAGLLYEKAVYDQERVRHAPTVISTAGFAESLGLSLKELAVSIDGLFRLRLCDIPASVIYVRGKDELPPASFWSVVPTLFGFEFMLAVTPPTA